MGKTAYKKTIIAGPLVKVARYSRAMPKDGPAVRRAKTAATSAAQKYVNIKNCKDSLELLLWCNFSTMKAHFCTFTFNEDTLPANKQHTKKIFAAYLKVLRKVMKEQGRELKYIYTVEGADLAQNHNAAPVAGQMWQTEPWAVPELWEKLDAPRGRENKEKNTRLHIHCFMNLEEPDIWDVDGLWPYGQVYISRIRDNEPETFSRLASYCTKESRNGENALGKRAYITSRNLKRPIVTGERCSESEPLELPEGAKSIKRGSEYNDTYNTSMEFLIYLMPERQDPQQQPRKKRRTPPK